MLKNIVKITYYINRTRFIFPTVIQALSMFSIHSFLTHLVLKQQNEEQFLHFLLLKAVTKRERIVGRGANELY